MNGGSASGTRVQNVLALAGLESFAARFAEEEIDDPLLDSLTEDDLRSLGLSLGARKRFKKALIDMRQASAAPNTQIAERRHLTVVFCDMVGSTQLAQRFDPEDLRLIITVYLESAVSKMKEHGGYLAYTQGDGFMMYFGYPQAEEDDADRALRGALATVEAVQAAETLVPEGINVRIGIATGRVVVGDMNSNAFEPRDFVVGETPNLAARLQALAAPGEVIASEETWALQKGRFEFDAYGKHALKGFAGERAAYLLRSELTTESRFDARAGGQVQPIVGREGELDQLLELWESASQGEGRVATLGGPAGIGKSRLMRRLSNVIGVPAITLQCAPHLASQALHPFVTELGRMAGLARGDSPQEATAKLAALIEATQGFTPEDLPLLQDLLRVEVEEALMLEPLKRARLTRELLLRWFDGLGRGPTAALVVLEDAHWADATTMELLTSLLDHLPGARLLLVLTHRPEFVPPAHFTDRGAGILLPSLAADQAEALAKSIAGDNLPPLLLRQIVEKADGVPLYVEEMTKSLLDQVEGQGGVSTDALAAMSVPATLQDSLMSRLDRMGPAKQVAQLGSVIGRSFQASMIEAIAPEGLDVADALGRLVGAGLLLQSDAAGREGYLFNHALVQDTAYDSLLREKRRGLHQKIARSMLDGGGAFGAPPPNVIAHHCDMGGFRQEAAQFWTAAGQAAATRSANVSAITALTAALRNIEELAASPERDRAELGVQMLLAPAYMATYGWGADHVGQAATRAQQLAQTLGDHESLFGATWGYWSHLFLKGELTPALETAELLTVMAQAAQMDSPMVMAHYAKAYTLYFRGELDAALAECEAGIGLNKTDYDMAMLPVFQIAPGSALRAIYANLLWLTGRPAEAYAEREAALSAARSLNHPPNLVHCYALTSMFMLYDQNWEAVDIAMQEAVAISEDEGFLYFAPMQNLYLSISQMGQGNGAEFAPKAHFITQAVFDSGSRLTLAQTNMVMADLMLRAGEGAAAMAHLETICGPAFDHHELVLKPEYHRVRALALHQQGDGPQARAEAHLARDTAQAQNAQTLLKRAEQALDVIETE